MRCIHITLKFSYPSRVEDEKRMFNRSDMTRDGRLDKQEWHVFLHPEYSAQGLVDIVNDLIELYGKWDIHSPSASYSRCK